MWFKNIFRPKPSAVRSRRVQLSSDDGPLFNEQFLRRLERLSLQAQRTLRGNPSSGEHLSRRQMPASIFSDHRPYSPGDDLRYVNWNVYARQNDILLKLGETEQDVNIHLLLDTSRSMAWGQPAKLRVAKRLIGAMGYIALAQSDRLHIVPFGATTQRAYGPVQGKARLFEMLRFIDTAPAQQATDVGAVLARYAQQYPYGGLVVVCSDLLAADGFAGGLAALSLPRWQVLVLHLLDQREIRPDLQGPIELEDSETGSRLPLVLDDDILATYQQNLTAWQETLRRTCGRYGATYAQVLTDWPLEQRIVPYLRLRRFLA